MNQLLIRYEFLPIPRRFARFPKLKGTVDSRVLTTVERCVAHQNASVPRAIGYPDFALTAPTSCVNVVAKPPPAHETPLVEDGAVEDSHVIVVSWESEGGSHGFDLCRGHGVGRIHFLRPCRSGRW